MRFEHEAAALGKFYEAYAFRIGEPEQDRVAVIFNDIYDRKEAEELRLQSLEKLQLEKAREHLLQRFLNVQEEERQRLSRELHDQFGQQLTALLLELKSLPSADPLKEQPAVIHRIERLQGIVDSLMQQMHHLAWELRPAALDNFGLEPTLRQYVREWSEQRGIAAEFVSHEIADVPRLPGDIETALYRVVQEALTNVQRHAQAQHVSVVLERHHGEVVAIIEDDGRGFEVEADESGPPGSVANRLGLLGMRERLELVSGTLTIESAPDEGTTVYARVLAPPSHVSDRAPEI